MTTSMQPNVTPIEIEDRHYPIVQRLTQQDFEKCKSSPSQSIAMSTVPNGWIYARFKDFAILQRGKDLTDSDVIPGEYPVVKSNGIDIYHNEYFVEPPGVVTGRSGTIGNAFFVKLPFWAHNTSLYVKDFKENDPKYIFYLIKKMDFRRYLAGTTVPTLNRNDIHALKVSIPESPSEQKAIAAILSKVDEAIEVVENSIKAAERLKRSLMQSLLTGKLKLDGTLRNEDEFYVNEKFEKVPVGWKVKPLKELATIQRGKFSHRPRNEPRFYGGNYPFVQTSDVVNSVFYLKQHSQTLSDLGVTVSRKFEKGMIIITIAANIGDVAVASYDVFFPDSLIGINPFEEQIDTKYLLLSLITKKTFLNQVATESAQKNINYGNLRPLPIFHPEDMVEQEQIAEKIEAVFKMIEIKQSKVQSLKNLKKSLMQNLLTGKVRVDVEKVNKLLEEV